MWYEDMSLAFSDEKIDVRCEMNEILFPGIIWIVVTSNNDGVFDFDFVG